MTKSEEKKKENNILVETEKEETSEFMDLLKEMNPVEKHTVKGIMLGFRLSRKKD